MIQIHHQGLFSYISQFSINVKFPNDDSCNLIYDTISTYTGSDFLLSIWHLTNVLDGRQIIEFVSAGAKNYEVQVLIWQAQQLSNTNTMSEIGRYVQNPKL